MSEVQPIVGTGDWHLGDRGAADDAFEPGVRWVIETALTVCRPRAVVVLGDLFECWQFRLSDILTAYADLLAWVDGQLAERDVPLIVLPGNHDNVPVEDLLRSMRPVMPRSGLFGYDSCTLIDGWRCSHGHEWDRWNRPGPLQPVAELATRFAGLIERAIPGFDEAWIDPRRLTSPARAKRASLQASIAEAADAHVQAFGGRVLYGHTHRLRINLDRTVVNCGSCTGGRGEFAVVWPGGEAAIYEM